MTSRASWLNLALIRENFKRFWPLMIGGLAFWLVCGPFALAMGGYPYSYHFMRSILRHLNPAPVLLNIALPVAMAVSCFSYLHRSNSSGVMHTMPFSRRSLFVSNYVSGLAMSLAPVVIISVILLFMRSGVETLFYDSDPVYATGTAILRFLLEEVTIIAFVYSVSVFAAVISGLAVIHTLTAVALNFICPALFLLMMGYMEVYEYGFTGGSLLEDFAIRMNPYLLILDADGFSAKEVCFYVLIALVITVAAYLLYKLRRLERAGDSYVFSPARYIIGFLMVFAASSVTGLVFQGEIGYAAYVLGFVVGYIIAQMIVTRSTKIFTKQCLASGLVYALVIAAVVCVFRLDLIGYQKRVPDPAKVQSVTIYSNTFDMGLDGVYDEISDPANIERVTNFHRQIVADPANYQKPWTSYSTAEYGTVDSRDTLEQPVSLQLTYAMKNGRTLTRDYWIPARMLKDSADMRDVWNSAENIGIARYLAEMDAKNLAITIEGYNLTDASGDQLSNWEEFDDDNYAIGNSGLSDKQALLDGLKKDATMIDYDSLFENTGYEPSLSVHLDFRMPADPTAPEDYISGNAWNYYDYDGEGRPIYKHLVMDVNVTKRSVNTLNALLNMNVSDDLKLAARIIAGGK